MVKYGQVTFAFLPSFAPEPLGAPVFCIRSFFVKVSRRLFHRPGRFASGSRYKNCYPIVTFKSLAHQQLEEGGRGGIRYNNR